MTRRAASARNVVRHLTDPLFATSYLLLIASVGASAFGFVFWIVAARSLSQETFASAGAAIAAMTFVAGLSATGLAQVLVRFLPRSGAGTAALIGRVYLSSGAIAGVVAVAAAATAGTWSPRLQTLFHDRLGALGFVAGSIALAIFALQDGALTGIGQARWIPVENILYGVLRLALLALLATGTLSVLVAWWLPALAAVGAVSALLFARLVPAHVLASAIERRPPAHTVRFAAASWLGSSLGLAAATAVPILVINSVEARESAQFYAAWTVMTGLALVSISTSTSLTATGSRDQAQLREATRRAFGQAIALSAVAVAVTVALASPLLGLFGPGYAGGANVLRVLALSVIPFCVSMLGLSVARVREAIGAIVLWEATLVTVALSLGAILVASNGSMGAAVAWLAAQSAAAVVALVTCLGPLHAPAAPEGGSLQPRRAAAPADSSVTRAATTNVSVVIPAWSTAREAFLERCLRSLHSQTVAPREVIVVVDHNPELRARIARRWPDIVTLESVGSRGASNARNTGTFAASGECVAFLDDDAYATPTWLERLSAAYATAGVVGVGGPLEPLWPEARPWWFPQEFDWVVGCTYRGLPRERSPVRNLIGANMSFRRETLLEIGGERQGFGRIGSNPIACEETELCIRIRRRWPEAELLFEPDARAIHQVTPERTQVSYFVRRCVAEGRGKAIISSLVGHGSGLASERRYTTRTLPSGVVRNLGAVARDPRAVGRATMIVVGFALTASGFVAQHLSRGSLRHAEASR